MLICASGYCLNIVLLRCLSAESHGLYSAHLDRSRPDDDHHMPPQNNVCMAPILQESAVHGYGVFAGKDLSPEFPGIPVEGSFHVFDSFAQVCDEAEANGVPIFPVGDEECLRKLCDKHESVRHGALLCLKPSACNPWYYSNSSCKSTNHPVLETNLKGGARFASINKKLKTLKDSPEALRVAGNVLTLTVNQSVKKDVELFIDYPFIGCVPEAQDDSEMEVE